MENDSETSLSVLDRRFDVCAVDASGFRCCFLRTWSAEVAWMVRWLWHGRNSWLPSFARRTRVFRIFRDLCGILRSIVAACRLADTARCSRDRDHHDGGHPE